MPLADAGDLSWNLAADLQGLFAYHFMVNAFRAGTIVAIAAALIRWFMVLRGESFVGHTLALVGFPGAAGATLLGVSATLGFFAFCIAAALIIALLPRGRAARGFSDESAVVGAVQAMALAGGFLFISLYHGLLIGVNALLFGSFLGVTDGQVLALLLLGITAPLGLAAIGRPLLFASIDADVAAAHGVPLRALSLLFLVLLGVAAAEASQITGTLLVFALLVVPPATAQLVTPNPLKSLALAVGLGLAITWAGLAASYYSDYPVGFFITSFAFAAYLLARLSQSRTAQSGRILRRRPAEAAA
ncbi:MAG TPA: metal ABC transporter permease [Dehalococcoidia bacterium]|nr:metal ABC transporter permease [Dehalococcoidia bacterium]